MSYVIVKHKVADYEQWKLSFDADGVTRQVNGSRGGQLFRSADDPNDVIMVIEWDLAQARQFRQSDVWSAQMRRAGVLGSPDVYFLEEIDQLPR